MAGTAHHSGIIRGALAPSVLSEALEVHDQHLRHTTAASVIEAPWLVHGGHSASLWQRFGSPVGARGGITTACRGNARRFGVHIKGKRKHLGPTWVPSS